MLATSKKQIIIISIMIVLVCSACGSIKTESAGENPVLVRLVYHDGTEKNVDVEIVERFLSEQVEEGFYCWGWTDGEGNVFSLGDAIPDILFQQCSVLFGDPMEHRAYVFSEKEGYDSERYVTQRNIAEMFSALLTEPKSEDGRVSSTEGDTGSEKDRWLEGLRRMRYYGIPSINLSDLDKRVTRGELYNWLSFCYPKADGVWKFSDVSQGGEFYESLCLAAEKGWLDYSENMDSGADQFITFREYLTIINKALGRRPARESIPAEVRLSFMNWAREEEWLLMLAEAAVDHSIENREEGEKWTTYQIPETLEPGPRWIDNDLYWVDENGRFVVGRAYDGFFFDNDGRYTSGSNELDEYVREVLNTVLTPDMTREEKLKTVYDYAVNHFSPGGGVNYEWGTEDWWPDAALTMFKRGRGDCSSFAAVFCSLARPLGYRMRVSTGQTFGAGVHSWAYMFVDGEEHIFDPQSEKRYSRNMFDMAPQRWKQFEYDPVYSEEPEWIGAVE